MHQNTSRNGDLPEILDGSLVQVMHPIPEKRPVELFNPRRVEQLAEHAPGLWSCALRQASRYGIQVVDISTVRYRQERRQFGIRGHVREICHRREAVRLK